MKDEIREELARGYCTERNSKKVLDPDLIEDMANEIHKLPKSEYCQCPESYSARTRNETNGICNQCHKKIELPKSEEVESEELESFIHQIKYWQALHLEVISTILEDVKKGLATALLKKYKLIRRGE